MRKRTTMIAALVFAVALLIVASVYLFSNMFNRNDSQVTMPYQNTGQADVGGFSGMGHMGGTNTVKLVDAATAMTKLKLPEMLAADSETATEITYTVTAQVGETAFKAGGKTRTIGYNGSYLGPVLMVREGQTVHINIGNQLSEATSFHWHGLKVPSDVDGGPHSAVAPNGTAQVDFTVKQEAATLWFHPHALGTTARQIYYGLAGLIYIEDEHSDSLDLPKDYGVNDFPLVLQDRTFDADNQFDYAHTYSADGTFGDTLLVNGTINPYIEVKNEKIRLRLVNGSNARNYRFSLNDQATFYQIASDGGFLESPVAMAALALSPGERAEIVVDMSLHQKGDTLKLMDGSATVLALKVTEEITGQTSLPEQLNTIPKAEDAAQLEVKRFTLSGMGFMVAINGKQFDMDRIDVEQDLNKKVIWEVYNAPDMMGGMLHPFHVHGVQFKVLSRNGAAPPLNEQGWKDTIAINPGETVRLEIEFPEKGVFMYHCHILEHEDIGMMGQVSVE